MDHFIKKELLEIKEHLQNQAIAQKEFLTLSEAAAYLNVSKSFLYKLTSRDDNSLPCLRPFGKLIYFKRIDLFKWIEKNRYQGNQPQTI